MSIHGLDTGLWIIQQPFSFLFFFIPATGKRSVPHKIIIPNGTLVTSFPCFSQPVGNEGCWNIRPKMNVERSARIKGVLLGFYTHTCRFERQYFPECRRATTCGNVVFYIYSKSLGSTVLKGFDHMMKNCSRLKRWPDCVWLRLWKRRDPVYKFDCFTIKPTLKKKKICIYFLKWGNWDYWKEQNTP